jgi:hypothetical protein
VTATIHDTTTIDPALLSRDELVAELLAADRARSAAEALELRLLGEFDARDEHTVDGNLSAALWLAQRGDVTRSTAGSMVADARKLRRHPDAMAACTRVGTARVREFLKRVTARTEAAFTEAEPVLLSQLGQFSVDDVILFARRWVELVDQDGPEPAEQKPSMSMGRTGDKLFGSLTLFGEDAALLANALDQESDRIYRGEGETHAEPVERRAEALMNLIRAAVGVDDTYDQPAKPTVVVHVTLEQLQGQGGRVAEIDPFGQPISDAAVRRLLCDCELHRFLTGPGGVVLNLGYSERLVKSYQRLALIARDRHCQFPGCDRPPSRCQGHHIVPWETGGRTDLANLVLLCNRHHHAVHEGGFHCTRLPDHTLQFRRPDGSVLEPPPKPG